MASVFRQKYRNRNGKAKESTKWYIQFRDHNGAHRRLPGYPEKKLTEELGRKLERLARNRGLNEPLDPELAAWLEAMPSDLKDRLAKWGMLDAQSVAEGLPLMAMWRIFGCRS